MRSESGCPLTARLPMLFYPHQGQARLARLPSLVNNQDYTRLPISLQLAFLVTRVSLHWLSVELIWKVSLCNLNNHPQILLLCGRGGGCPSPGDRGQLQPNSTLLCTRAVFKKYILGHPAIQGEGHKKAGLKSRGHIHTAPCGQVT